MLKNFLRINVVRPLNRQRGQIGHFGARLKTTNEFSGDLSSSQTNQVPVKTHSNPFAREISKNKESVLDNVGSINSNIELTEDEKKKRLKVLQLEVDIANQEGRRVPSLEFFKDHHWEHVLTLSSKSARMKYYSFLWQVEMKKESKQRKKEERALASQERMEKVRQERAENPHIVYGLGHVSMFLRVYDSTINNWMNHRLIRAMQFSPKIVLDCSYDDHMTKREAENAAKQLMLCFAENRAHDDPFDLHYCNVNLDTPCMKSLQRYIPTMLNPEFPMNVHEKCFTEIFPKENLVYLTPHCRTDLVEYNPDDVYIVGAMVDTINNEPLSLAKAKRLGLRMARLPLDHYLQWGAGSGKSLTLNQMVNIMLDLKHTSDWMTALRHVPRRKVIDLKKDAENFRNKLNKHANRVNVRIDRLLRNEDDSLEYNHNNKIRSHKNDLQFNLSTWGSKKKERQ
ncbi:mitochondrial ribonuclease P protein 1 homolog [Lucilia sericata]|uniref:mitochondrial ribonuclease P protein 1 homolog n=1 Tax=Lucilia sericata TaxID=13632 RepID=UPI0018A823AE|nr:mitochondrial ribonuclease P protein 1 homolog [Lucilia sericata]